MYHMDTDYVYGGGWGGSGGWREGGIHMLIQKKQLHTSAKFHLALGGPLSFLRNHVIGSGIRAKACFT